MITMTRETVLSKYYKVISTGGNVSTWVQTEDKCEKLKSVEKWGYHFGSILIRYSNFGVFSILSDKCFILARKFLLYLFVHFHAHGKHTCGLNNITFPPDWLQICFLEPAPLMSLCWTVTENGVTLETSTCIVGSLTPTLWISSTRTWTIHRIVSLFRATWLTATYFNFIGSYHWELITGIKHESVPLFCVKGNFPS